jgi:hypothetical protein
MFKCLKFIALYDLKEMMFQAASCTDQENALRI